MEKVFSPSQLRDGDGGVNPNSSLAKLDKAKMARLEMRFESPQPVQIVQPTAVQVHHDVREDPSSGQDTASTLQLSSSTMNGLSNAVGFNEDVLLRSNVPDKIHQPGSITAPIEIQSGGSNSNYSIAQQQEAWSRSREGENSLSNTGKHGPSGESEDDEHRSGKRQRNDNIDISQAGILTQVILMKFKFIKGTNYVFHQKMI